MTNLQKLDSEYQQKLIPYTISGHEGLSGLPDPLISETLTAESRAKVEAILTEYHLKRAAIVAEREARLADEPPPCGDCCRMSERRSSSASARSKFVYNRVYLYKCTRLHL